MNTTDLHAASERFELIMKILTPDESQREVTRVVVNCECGFFAIIPEAEADMWLSVPLDMPITPPKI